MEYLGLVSPHDGVKVDPKKTKAIMEYTCSKTLNNIRGFLVLMNYCCNFLKNYGQIVALITMILRKEEFCQT